MRRLIRFLPALGWMGLIFFLSAQSSLPLPKGIWNFDKVLHFGAYGILGLTWLFALRARAWRAALVAVVITSAYGASDEFHQSFVPGRSTEFLDWLADTLGGGTAALVWLGYGRARVPTKSLP